MATVKKRKLKLKKKNFFILLLILFLMTFTVVKIVSFIAKPSKLQGEKIKVKDEEKVTSTNSSEKDINLEKLDGIDKKIDYFNYDNIDRYLAYKELNSNLDITQIIIDVNMGIDKEYYTNTKKTKDLNKSYILVNKYNYLTEDYVPKNLEKISLSYARSGMKLVDYAKDAFEEMAKDASENDLTIIAMSSYRGYDYQVDLYNKYVKSDGVEAADTYSARAGFSEHQTGLAVDVYNGKETYTNFESTKEFDWMMENAHKYGFILRFPKDKEKETGYKYESWHYRYVGKEISKYIKENNISFEEYYVKFIENKKIN